LPESVTACLIARDEERRLPACLQTLGFCDEVVVVDGGSHDRTIEIARAAGARVIENPWPGFAAQRNVALDHAQGDWVLEIDADERVSPELAAEVGAMLAAPPARMQMAAIPMRDVFLGRPLGPSARYPRYRHRLFRRDAYRHDDTRTVHEGLWPDGPVLALAGELEHRLADGWGEAIGDTLRYARLEGGQRPRTGPLATLGAALPRPLAKLAYRTLLYGGWRDGWRGLAKIGLECGGDSLAALYGLRLGTGAEPAEPPRIGPLRFVGIAIAPGDAVRLGAWLAGAAEMGGDVSLVCRDAPAGLAVPVRELSGGGPGALARALDAEDQIRPIDALLAAGRRERALLRFCPRALRGGVPPLRPEWAVGAAVSDVQERLREPG